MGFVTLEPGMGPGSDEVIGVIVVDADVDHVRGWLSDPRRLLSVTDPDAVLWDDGDCTGVVGSLQHPLAPVVYTARWCPTDDGAHVTLTAPDDLAAYDARFTTRVVPGGVEVRYALALTPAFHSPASADRAAARREVEQTLRAVAQAFVGAVRVVDL